MKNNSIITIALMTIYITLVTPCCSNSWKNSDRMEGFRKGYFRVYVRINPVWENGESKTEKEINREIINTAKKRCAQYLKSHIKSTIDEEKKINRVINIIKTVLEKAKISHQECYDEYCEAFVDFDTKGLEKLTQQNHKE